MNSCYIFFYCIFVWYYVIGLFHKYWGMLSWAVSHLATTLNHFSQKLYDTIKIVCLQWWPNHTKEWVVSAIFWLKLLGYEWDRMWHNSIHVYLYLEVMNYSFSPIFWAPSNQFSAGAPPPPKKNPYIFRSFRVDIFVAHNTLRWNWT